MDNKSVFNATVCLMGIILLLIHTINILVKKNRRNDENNLLVFIVFTTIHLATYLIFTLLKPYYANDDFIMGFYTTFYIMNNIQLLLLFVYTITYLPLSRKGNYTLLIINFSLLATFIALDIINIFNHMFFTAEGGVYVRAKTMIISQGYQFFCFATVFGLALFSKKLKVAEKIAFTVYCLLPLVAILLQNIFAGYAIAYLSVIISIEILFLFINVRKNIELANEAKRKKEAEVKVMMSQIQPHFIYNTLASISTLIKIDPDKAQEGLDQFTEYLRANLSSLSESGLILFSDELKHIETYISLEKMRFDERLTVKYDIKVKDFLVPPLSIQPIVENAVKHGVLKKIEGGIIEIKSYEDKEANYVQIIDNGVGFDLKHLKKNSSTHIGINNVKYRIASMCRGEMIIKSEKNKGTNVLVKFYK